MSRAVLKEVDRVIERLSNFFAILSGILIVLMAFIASYGVVRRYIFKRQFPD